MREPSGDHATDSTQSVCPSRVRTSRPVSAAQILIVVSNEPLTICELSGDHATESTKLPCPRSVWRSVPVLAAQTLIVASADPLAMRVPSVYQVTTYKPP